MLWLDQYLDRVVDQGFRLLAVNHTSFPKPSAPVMHELSESHPAMAQDSAGTTVKTDPFDCVTREALEDWDLLLRRI